MIKKHRRRCFGIAVRKVRLFAIKYTVSCNLCLILNERAVLTALCFTTYSIAVSGIFANFALQIYADDGVKPSDGWV